MKQTPLERLLVADEQAERCARMFGVTLPLSKAARWRRWFITEQAIEDHHAGFQKRQAARVERWKTQVILAAAMLAQARVPGTYTLRTQEGDVPLSQ